MVSAIDEIRWALLIRAATVDCPAEEGSADEAHCASREHRWRWVGACRRMLISTGNDPCTFCPLMKSCWHTDDFWQTRQVLLAPIILTHPSYACSMTTLSAVPLRRCCTADKLENRDTTMRHSCKNMKFHKFVCSPPYASIVLEAFFQRLWTTCSYLPNEW